MREVGSRRGDMVIPSMGWEEFRPFLSVDITPKEDTMKKKYGQDYVEKVAALRGLGLTNTQIQERLDIPGSGSLHTLITEAKKQGLIDQDNNEVASVAADVASGEDIKGTEVVQEPENQAEVANSGTLAAFDKEIAKGQKILDIASKYRSAAASVAEIFEDENHNTVQALLGQLRSEVARLCG